MRIYWYEPIVKIILYAMLGLISFMIIVPELFIFISLALNSEKSSVVRKFPKSNISWIDDIPISINKFFVNLPTQEKLLWILLLVVVYLILLVLIKYRDVYILFILSNIYVIYFIYTEVVYIFKLMVAWNIVLTTIISLVAIGIRLAIFEIIRGIIEGIIDTILGIIFKIGNIKYKGNIESNKEEAGFKQQEQYKHYEQYQESTSGNFKYNKEENNSKNKDDDNNEQYIRSEEKYLKTSYEVLGVSKEDDIETIKKVYKLLSKTYHPDINSSALANDKFIEIKEAWEKISKERNYK